MNHKDLIVWQKSFQLTLLVYKLCEKLPKGEQFGLVSQIKRSAISVPSNIAEGYGRVSKKYFHNFLKISLGSLLELETQLLLTRELNFLDDSDLNLVESLMLEVQKILGTLIKNNK
jgi:four helix bundle protein